MPAARRTAAKWLALLFSLATLALAIVVLVRFDPDGDRYQLTESHSWIADFGVRYELGVDGIAVALIALTALLIPFVIAGRLARRRPAGDAAANRAGGRPRASSR